MTIKKIIVGSFGGINNTKKLNKQNEIFECSVIPESDLWNSKEVLQTTKCDSNDPAENKNTSIRELLSNLASQSNVHGISSLAGDKSAPLKFFWGLAFLGLLAFAVFQLYTIGTIYYSFPVKTKVKMEFKPLPFPAITICNMNTIRRSKIYDVQSNTLQQMLNGTYQMTSGTTHHPSSVMINTPLNNPTNGFPPTNGYSQYQATTTAFTTSQSTTGPSTTASATGSTTGSAGGSSGSNTGSQHGTDATTTSGYNSGVMEYVEYDSYNDYDYYDNVWSSWDYFPYTLPLESSYAQYEMFLEEYLKINRDKKKEIGHQLENMLLGCQFNGRKCDVPIKDVVTYDYGNCFTIQSSNFIAGSTGPMSGMVLTINLENHEAIEYLTEGYGMRMVVHEPKSFPLPLEEGITISGGYETSIGLKMTRIERKGDPYGTCIDPRQYFATYGIRYSTQTCIQQCWEKLAYSRCGCLVGNVHSEIGRFHDQDNVNSKESKGCFKEQDKKCSIDARRALLGDIDKYCRCPQPCLENAYTTTFSGRIWPHKTKLNELRQDACFTYEDYNITGYCALENWNDASLSTNFLKVNIYFEDLNYEVISEEPLYDTTQLISDVGGSLGLCLGASLLCICEVFEAIAMIFVVLCRKMRGHSAVLADTGHQMATQEYQTPNA